MNYFAKLSNNIVTEVICLSETITDGVSWCVEQYGGKWVQNYYGDANKKYGNLGDIYDPVNDVFVAPQAPEAES